MTTPPLAEVPIRLPEELAARWAAILHPPVFSSRTLWMTWIDHNGQMLRTLLPVQDFPELPDAELREGLRRVHVGMAQSQLPRGGGLAMALCRPGRSQVSKDDEAVAQSLREAFDGVPVAPWPTLHLAAGGSVLPIDLLA